MHQTAVKLQRAEAASARAREALADARARVKEIRAERDEALLGAVDAGGSPHKIAHHFGLTGAAVYALLRQRGRDGAEAA